MPPKTIPVWLPYFAPFIVFLLLTTLESKFTAVYPALYTVKILLTGGLLFYFRRCYPEARPSEGKNIWLGAVLGVALVVLWVSVDKHTPHFAFLGGRIGYNPWVQISSALARAAFLSVRFLGLAIVVPFMEELLYRSFLLRFVTDMDNFQRVPVGTFSLIALLINVGMFSLSHPEWLAAAIFGLTMCLLVARTKSLFACVVAHGTTNLLLGVYVCYSHQWQYW